MNEYDIWFSRVEISNNIKLKLLENFEVNEIWNFNKNNLIELGLHECTINEILNSEYRKKLDKYEKYLENNKIQLIKLNDEAYPYKLKNISNRPAYIFLKGNKEALYDDGVAIIGSRHCTENGKKIAFQTAKKLGDRNVNVISGLAIRNRYICTYGKFKK